MFISELLEDYDLDETKLAWARRGKSVVRKYRCTSGKRKSRVVNSPADCFKAFDVKKRQKMKLTRARLASRMARKRARTMKTNPASRRVKALNK